MTKLLSTQHVLEFIFLLLISCLSSAQVQSPIDPLEVAASAFIKSSSQNLEDEFNKFMQVVSPDCTNSKKLEEIQKGGKLADISELYNFACLAKKILEIKSTQDPLIVKKVLEKISTLENSSKQICQNNLSCQGVYSCLPITQDDYKDVLGGRGAILELLSNAAEDQFSVIQIGTLLPGKSCNFNFECESLYCEKSSGTSSGLCVLKKTCRLGRDFEKVKENGQCIEGLEKDSSQICYSSFKEESFVPTYKKFKEELAKTQCGEFKSASTINSLSALALDLRAFELMIKYAQNLSKDLNGFKGGNLDHYHKIPQKIQSEFLTEYVDKRQIFTSSLNKELSDFTKNYTTVLSARGESTDKVNFYDISVIEKEMKSQKETSVYYIQLYANWIKAEQKYYQINAQTINSFMIDDLNPNSFMHFLSLLARTKENEKTAPLFGGTSGKKNDRRWYLSLYLPKNVNDYKIFQNSPYLEYKELEASGFSPLKNNVIQNALRYEANNWHWSKVPSGQNYSNNYYNLSIANDSHLLDPILPPNGCQLIDSTANECNGNSSWFIEGANNILGVKGFNGTFDKDLNNTLKILYDAWYKAIVDHYKELSKNLPSNSIIDPELNFYAGCFQNLNSAKFQDDPGMENFYKNFCARDLNRNGKIEDEEKIQENTLKRLAKKILSYSLAYSFNKHKRKIWFGMSRSYRDEFKQDESHKTEKRPSWIDSELNSISTDTKFYNFSYGVKKNFLNRIRNRYFFLGSFYYLMSKNFDKQLACIQGSMGDYRNVNVIENDKTPTPTPDIPKNGATTNPNDSNAKSKTSNNDTNGKNSKNGSSAQYNNSSDTSNYEPSEHANSELELSRQNNSKEDLNENDKRKTQVLDGVAIKTEKTKNTNSAEANSSYYSGGFNAGTSDNFDSSSNGQNSEQEKGLSDEEYSKISSTLNSNLDPQFSDNDTIFSQITRRYIKNYGKIFSYKKQKISNQ